MRKLLFVVVLAAAAVAWAQWDRKPVFTGRFYPQGTNASMKLPLGLRGSYLTVECHDDGGMMGAGVDTALGSGRSYTGPGGGLTTNFPGIWGGNDAGAGCWQPDGGLACRVVRFSGGEVFYEQMAPYDDTIFGFSDAGIDACEVYVSGS